MRIMLKSFSFASPHLGGLTLVVTTAKHASVDKPRKERAYLPPFKKKKKNNNRISFICLTTALEETSNWLLVKSSPLPPP